MAKTWVVAGAFRDHHEMRSENQMDAGNGFYTLILVYDRDGSTILRSSMGAVGLAGAQKSPT